MPNFQLISLVILFCSFLPNSGSPCSLLQSQVAAESCSVDTAPPTIFLMSEGQWLRGWLMQPGSHPSFCLNTCVGRAEDTRYYPYFTQNHILWSDLQSVVLHSRCLSHSVFFPSRKLSSVTFIHFYYTNLSFSLWLSYQRTHTCIQTHTHAHTPTHTHMCTCTGG